MNGYPMNQKFLSGLLLITISAFSFGAMPVFARYAYREGTDVLTLLFLRFVTAGLIMLLLLRLKGAPLPRGKPLLGLMGMGGLGYVGQSMCYFTALTLAPAGLVALLLYLYPALVALMAALIFKERMGGSKIAALFLALFGAALVIGPERGGQPLGIVLGLGAAFIYAVYILSGSRLMQNVQPIQASTVIMVSAAMVFGVVMAFRQPQLPQSMLGWFAILALAVISTVIAIVTFMAGLERVGPTNASMLSTVEPVVTVVLAAVLLGETVSTVNAAGGALILSAVIVLTRGVAGEEKAIKSPTPG